MLDRGKALRRYRAIAVLLTLYAVWVTGRYLWEIHREAAVKELFTQNMRLPCP